VVTVPILRPDWSVRLVAVGREIGSACAVRWSIDRMHSDELATFDMLVVLHPLRLLATRWRGFA